MDFEKAIEHRVEQIHSEEVRLRERLEREDYMKDQCQKLTSAEGLPIAEAFFLKNDAKVALKGLILSTTFAGIEPPDRITVGTEYRMVAKRIFRRDIFKRFDTEIPGWKFPFARGRDYEGSYETDEYMLISVSEKLFRIETQEYDLYRGGFYQTRFSSGTEDRNGRSINDSALNFVIDYMAKNNLSWVEPNNQ